MKTVTLPVLNTQEEAEKYGEELSLYYHSALQETRKKSVLLLEYCLSKQWINAACLAMRVLLRSYTTFRIMSKRAIQLMHKAEKMLKKYPNNRHKGDILITLAFMRLLLSQRSEALEYFLQAEQWFQAQGYIPSRVYTSGAQLFMECGDFTKGYTYIFTAESLCIQEYEELLQNAQKNAVEIRANILRQIQITSLTTAFFMSIEDFHYVEKYVNVGLWLTQEEGLLTQRAHFLSQLSNLLIMSKEYDKVEHVAEEALTLYYKTKIPMIGINSYMGRAVAAMHKGELEKSRSYAYHACKIAASQRDKKMQLHPHFYLTEILLKDPSRTVEARKTFDTLMELCGNNKNSGIWIQSRRFLAILAEQEGNTDLQIQSMKEYIEAAEQSKVRSNILRSNMHREKSKQQRTFLQDSTQHKNLPQLHITSTNEPQPTRIFDTLPTAEYINAIRGSIAELLEKSDTLKLRELKTKLRSIHRILEENLNQSVLLDQTEKEIPALQKDFALLLAKKYPFLSATEQRICTLLRMPLNTHQIASVMSISPQTVFTHRKHIRKKLDIPQSLDLHTFLLALEENSTSE